MRNLQYQVRIYQKSHNTVTNHNYILCVVRIFYKQTLGTRYREIFATCTLIRLKLIEVNLQSKVSYRGCRFHSVVYLPTFHIQKKQVKIIKFHTVHCMSFVWRRSLTTLTRRGRQVLLEMSTVCIFFFITVKEFPRLSTRGRQAVNNRKNLVNVLK